jgi:hypothetical protein
VCVWCVWCVCVCVHVVLHERARALCADLGVCGGYDEPCGRLLGRVQGFQVVIVGVAQQQKDTDFTGSILTRCWIHHV